MNKNHLSTRFYLAQVYQSFSDYLTSTFQLQLYTFFWSTLGVHTKLNQDLFLNLHKKKMCFQLNSNQWEHQRWMKEISKAHFIEKSIRKQIWKSKWEGFSWQPNTPTMDWRKSLKGVGGLVVSVLHNPRMKILGLNRKENP